MKEESVFILSTAIGILLVLFLVIFQKPAKSVKRIVWLVKILQHVRFVITVKIII